MRDEFFGIVNQKANSIDYCVLEAPLFLVGKGKDKAAGDCTNQTSLFTSINTWLSFRQGSGASKPPSAKALTKPHRPSPPSSSSPTLPAP